MIYHHWSYGLLRSLKNKINLNNQSFVSVSNLFPRWWKIQWLQWYVFYTRASSCTILCILLINIAAIIIVTTITIIIIIIIILTLININININQQQIQQSSVITITMNHPPASAWAKSEALAPDMEMALGYNLFERPKLQHSWDILGDLYCFNSIYIVDQGKPSDIYTTSWLNQPKEGFSACEPGICMDLPGVSPWYTSCKTHFSSPAPIPSSRSLKSIHSVTGMRITKFTRLKPALVPQ